VSAPGAKGETRIEDPTAAERAIARRAAEARATVPDLELRADVDMTRALRLRDEDGCSIAAILVLAAARALNAVPRANGAYRDGRFELYSRVNVGIVVADEGAYLIPTVFDADQRSLLELTEEIERLSAAARAGELQPPAYAGATGCRRTRGPGLDDRRQLAAGRGSGRRRDPPRTGGPGGRTQTRAHDDRHARLRSPDPLRCRRRAIPV
jgi:pyruvate/2-oxoglutarate dehydrogenase complex dihydrolipoamide acyltransferase (E2) component